MEFVGTLRSKASASFAAAQSAAVETKTKASEAITSRINSVSEAIQSARSAAAARASQARTVVFDLATTARQAAEGLRADLQAKGLKAVLGEASSSSMQVARDLAASAKARAVASSQAARAMALDNLEAARQRAGEAKDRTVVKAKEIYTATGEVVSQKSFQATAASATAGAMTLGAGGAATGLAAGGVAGAAAGLPLALFTFGLSIPIGAVVGGGAGLVVGSAAGATTGLVGGGAAGYGVYTKKDDIRGAANSAMAKASGGADAVRGNAYKSVEYAKGVVVAARARLARAGTGETSEQQ